MATPINMMQLSHEELENLIKKTADVVQAKVKNEVAEQIKEVKDHIDKNNEFIVKAVGEYVINSEYWDKRVRNIVQDELFKLFAQGATRA